MSGLRAPGLGPIVGHTTDHSCRLWIRAADPGDAGSELASERRTIGIVALVASTGGDLPESPPVYYFRLHREYDRTGTFTLGEDSSLDGRGKTFELKPGVRYTARLGTLTVDDPFGDDESVDDKTLGLRLPPADEWVDELRRLSAKKCEAVFETFPDSATATDRLSFIVGSCRYPGMLWKAKRADRIFGPMRKEAARKKNGAAAKFVLMVGDQIYADMLNRFVPIGLADTFAEFQERYLSAFGSRKMRKLLRSVPTYMILDDHEIEDNWTQDRIGSREKRMLFNLAINAYMSYQWSHGPRNFDNRLYYEFACGGYPFFVLDTRTQRFMDGDGLADNHLLGRPSLDPANEPNQIDRLLAWIEDQQRDRKNTPKFIVSSSVFVPNPMTARAASTDKRKEQSDSWPGFPTTRRKILDCIVDQGIQNVVFISGDIHCSNVAQMSFGGTPEAKKLKAFSVTSSAFYWPFPFADGDPSNYVHDSSDPGQADSFNLSGGVTMDYRAWNFTQEDNYCRLDIDKAKHEITVRAFSSDGSPIPAPGPNVLQLARW